MDTDVLIVGGGIAGLSAGAALAPHGAVTVLEAESALAYHASGRSAALFEPRYGPAPVVALSQASEAAFRSMPGVLSPRGLMVWAAPGEDAAFEAEARAMDLAEIAVEEARARVPVLNPAAVARVAAADHARDIDTDALVQRHARAIRAAGGRVVTGAGVTAVARAGAGWRVETAAGSFAGAILVDAAGAWADRVATMAGVATLGLTPLRRSMARIPPPGGHDVAGWPMVFGTGESWYAKPDAGALIVSPAEEDPADPHDAWACDLVLAEGLARYEAMVTEPVTRILANWAGLRTFAPDRIPAIGFAADAPGFVWLAGQGGYGFQTSPAAAALAADLILGRPPAIDDGTLAALSPARFSR